MFPPCATTAARVAAQGEHRGDLARATRAHDRARLAVEAAGPVGLVRGAELRIDEHVPRTDDADERVEKRVGAGHVTYGDTMRERVEP